MPREIWINFQNYRIHAILNFGITVFWNTDISKTVERILVKLWGILDKNIHFNILIQTEFFFRILTKKDSKKGLNSIFWQYRTS